MFRKYEKNRKFSHESKRREKKLKEPIILIIWYILSQRIGFNFFFDF